MKKIVTSWTFRIALALIAASALFYTIHYLLFHDAHHIFIYMIGDFGFLFIDVLLVLLVIERLLAGREKKSILHKLNMVIGTFFSEVGMELLRRIGDFVENAEKLESDVLINPQWNKKDFLGAQAKAASFKYNIVLDADKLEELRNFLKNKHAFLVRLLENPILLDNQRFTDLLWAVFHLSEELNLRNSLQSLPEGDIAHLVSFSLFFGIAHQPAESQRFPHCPRLNQVFYLVIRSAAHRQEWKPPPLSFVD
jgi:hypothetical protein